MATKALITQHEKYFLLSLDGEEMNQEDSAYHFNEILKQAVEKNVHVIIYRKNVIEMEVPMVHFYSFSKLMEKNKFFNKLALVYLPEVVASGQLNFFLTASRNRGKSVQLFENIDDATNWIEA